MRHVGEPFGLLGTDAWWAPGRRSVWFAWRVECVQRPLSGQTPGVFTDRQDPVTSQGEEVRPSERWRCSPCTGGAALRPWTLTEHSWWERCPMPGSCGQAGAGPLWPYCLW